MDFYRLPLNGRNFEYMTGEDPYLGSQLVPEIIKSIQAEGVWACAKHYVCNDEEENRGNVNILVDERALREIYLPPFEAAVKVGKAATVMGAYNAVNGDFCCESAFLIQRVLKGDWGFKGAYISDYDAIHNGVKAAATGCDLDLPAGLFMNPTTLGPVIGAGLLPVSNIDDKVRRLLREVVSYGYLDRQQLDPSIPLDDPDSEAAALQIAREGIVLLRNTGGFLPLDPGKVRTVAVLGRLATGAPPTGFGSSYVTPISYVSELDGIRTQAPAGTQVDYITACTLDPTLSQWEYTDVNGALVQGLQAQYFDSNDLSGTPEVTRADTRVNFDWDTSPIPVTVNQGTFSARWTGRVRAQISGDHVFKVRADGGLRLFVNGNKVIDDFNTPPLPPVGYGPTVPRSAKVNLQAGKTYDVVIEYRRTGGFFDTFEQGGFTGVQASWASLVPPANLGTYDAVIASQGIDNQYEGEGQDREFTLPEYQDELLHNLALANRHTVVVLHGGGNFDTEPWVHQAAGLLHTFYPGQNGGQALAEILFGDVNPSGKLPVTFERRITDNPAYATFPKPVNQHPDSIAYQEGIFVGYRGYERNGVQPHYPFGFGLSYTTFGFSDLKVSPATFDGTTPVTVTYTVTNTGTRYGAEVSQLYVGQQNPSIVRPAKELKGFAKVYLQPGESKQVTLRLDQRSFAYWNTSTQKWTALPGTYTVRVGSSSQDLPLTTAVSVPKEVTANP